MTEQAEFNVSSLINPRFTHDRNSNFQYAGNVGDVAHSVRVYKGRVFLLVIIPIQSVVTPG
jgi:vacuolar protein sorting-associated protein 8